MKKFAYIALAFVLGVITSCTDKEEVEITRHHTLSYVVNTQSMYDELGITSEVVSNYLSKNYNVGIYTFVYDSDENLVEKISFKESSLGTVPETFKYKEGTYTIVTYETLVGNGYTPSWSGEEKLSTLVFEDNSSKDYHYTLGAVETKVTLIGGDKTETASPAATRHLLTLNIGTQGMYDTFDVRGSFEDIWLSESYNYYVGVMSLVYDNNGQFVDSVSTYIKTFQSVQQKFSLRDGNYTIVTIETLVNGDNNYTSNYWKIDNIQNLSSVVLMNNSGYSDIYWGGVVGTSSCTVSVGNSNQSQAITPSAIGSLVQVTAANFDKSDYSLVGFYTKNAPDGIMLSPNVMEKYYYNNYEKSNYWKARGEIGNLKDYVFSENEGMTIYIIESGSINWLFGCSNESSKNDDGSIKLDDYPRNGSKYTFNDGKIYYAYIRYRGDAKGCDANLGTYDEILTWVANLDPIGVLYVEPYTVWGSSVASVKSFMSDYVPYNNGNIKEENGQYVLTYAGKYEENQIRYWFTTETGGLIYSVVFFDSEKIGEDDLYRAFDEMGYSFVMSGEGYSYYKTKDNKSYVYVSVNNQNYWFVRYFDASSTSASSRVMKQEPSTVAPQQQTSVKSKNYGKTSVVKTLRQCENTMKLYYK